MNKKIFALENKIMALTNNKTIFSAKNVDGYRKPFIKSSQKDVATRSLAQKPEGKKVNYK